MKIIIILFLVLILSNVYYCKKNNKNDIKNLLDQYSEFKLEENVDYLDESDKKMLPILFKIADIMDDIFWFEEFGNKKKFLKKLKSKEEYEYALINYGPWDRLTEETFIKGYAPRNPRINYYPHDITDSEFDDLKNENKTSPYTIIKRNKNGKLYVKWYHEEFKSLIKKASQLLEHASMLSNNSSFGNYLKLRSKAFLNDDYFDSDISWMDLKDNNIDFIVGPIETYADGFRGIKAAHSSQILLKDLEWSKKIEKYNSILPELQKNLPVPREFKKENTSRGDMYVYNLIYSTGDANWGPKSIAINLPNDPNVQKIKGSRKLQLKNVMKAKFDNILIPIAKLFIDDSQLNHVVFENGFFPTVMFHEIAHGLGVKFVVNNSKLSVHEALQEHYNTLEEAKADITGVFFLKYLIEHKLIEMDIMDCYVTFVAGILRSVRFGTNDAHGKANLFSFNFLYQSGAFSKQSNGKYLINKVKMDKGVMNLVNEIITIQGLGDKIKAGEWIDNNGKIDKILQDDIDKISKTNIPKDIVYKQGIKFILNQKHK